MSLTSPILNATIPKYSTDDLTTLQHKAKLFGSKNDLFMHDKAGNAFLCPVPLFPTLLPSEVFNRMYNNHHLMQKLYAIVASDHEFLLSTLKPMVGNDPFLNMLVTTLEQNFNRQNDPICLLSRSDYMIHENNYTSIDKHNEISTFDSIIASTIDNDNQKQYPQQSQSNEIIINNIGYQPLQVEFNAISVGLMSLSERVQKLHQHLFESHSYSHIIDTSSSTQYQFPPHQGAYGPASTLAIATQYQIQRFGSNYTNWVILMVVQDGEFNVPDQSQIQRSLQCDFGIDLIRATLNDIEQYVTYNISSTNNNDINNITNDIDGNNIINDKPPMWKGERPIAVIYYRSCYTPRDFGIITNEISNESQRLINIYQNLEKSNAIKCPNIGLHLAGTKKIQQMLTRPEILFKFIPNQDECNILLSMFTGIYSLQGNDYNMNQNIIQHAINNPHEYVLKPMREGGGNNYYDNELKDFLMNKSINEINAMILMKRITPNTTTQTTFLRQGELTTQYAAGEYGILGGLLCVHNKKNDCNNDNDNHDIANNNNKDYNMNIIQNATFGSLIRLKSIGANEGGLATGSGYLGSIVTYE